MAESPRLPAARRSAAAAARPARSAVIGAGDQFVEIEGADC